MTQMADSGLAESFGALPAELADLLRPEIAALSDEIVSEIGRCVPEFAPFGEGPAKDQVAAAVARGLRQFIDRIADPGLPAEVGVALYRALGRSEFVSGRSLDGLQGAFRVGARVAWRCYAQTGKRAGLPPDTMYMLAETVFAFIEEAGAHAVGGYSDLRAQLAGEVERKRRRLLELLVADPPVASQARIAELAAEARWHLPERVACAALDEPWRTAHLVSPAVDSGILMDLDRPDPYLVVPDPEAPGRSEQLLRAFGEARLSIGPAVAIGEAPLSLRMARQGLVLAGRGVFDGYPVRCEEHLPTFVFLQDERVMRLLAERSMAPFARFSRLNRARLSETLYAWLRVEGKIVDVAELLHLHPQTVRYRMRQIEEMFGTRLHDPDWRFEMEMGLRVRDLLTEE
ncbi:helix-turn-helix domain-containing protein [Actinocorallia longicatena]|uniref:PucR family transcriptional regulator n=1 Tax=Actinocorallia longicatena TaxID=111803 RepID=A0ABP6QG79_9ACTN